jgi:hypothetical protein
VGHGGYEKSWGGWRKNVGKGKKKKIPPLCIFVQRHGYVGGLDILFTERTFSSHTIKYMNAVSSVSANVSYQY